MESGGENDYRGMSQLQCTYRDRDCPGDRDAGRMLPLLCEFGSHLALSSYPRLPREEN